MLKSKNIFSTGFAENFSRGFAENFPSFWAKSIHSQGVHLDYYMARVHYVYAGP